MRPLPRSKAERVRQVAAWLASAFPTPFPVSVRIVPRMRGLCGDTARRGRRITIRLHAGLDWPSMIDTLLHEWAHAACWTFEHVEAWKPPHDDHWAVTYGRIYRRFHDERGAEEARDF